MKSRVPACRLAGLIVVALCAVSFAAPGVRAQSDSTPELKTVAPKDVKALIAANKGKVVFLNFFATYCVPCHTEFPEIEKIPQRNIRTIESLLPKDRRDLFPWL